MYGIEKTVLDVQGETVAMELFRPAGQGPFPAVAIVGPVGFVKEQSPLQYATRLASHGVAALIFDPRYHGESSGEPRRLESGAAKIEDLNAVIGFLSQLDGIDTQHLHVLGICQGVNWAIESAAQNDAVASVGLVAGHYLTEATTPMYLGQDGELERRLARSDAAATHFERTGEVQYIPIVGTEQAFLRAPPPADWYLPWENQKPWFAHRGKWENRMAAMSEAGIWNWRIEEAAARLSKPVLMVHGDMAASGAQIPQDIFEMMPSQRKSLHWVNGANQLQFYEHPPTIDAAMRFLVPHFLGAHPES